MSGCPLCLTPTQSRVYRLVAQGIATAADVQRALAHDGVVRGLRAVQRLLKRVRDKGFVLTVRFPRDSGRRGHFHLGTAEGDAACLQQLGSGTAPQPPHRPPPDWAAEAVRQGETIRVHKLTWEERKREIDRYMPSLRQLAADARLGRPMPMRRPRFLPPRRRRLPPAWPDP